MASSSNLRAVEREAEFGLFAACGFGLAADVIALSELATPRGMTTAHAQSSRIDGGTQ